MVKKHVNATTRKVNVKRGNVTVSKRVTVKSHTRKVASKKK